MSVKKTSGIIAALTLSAASLTACGGGSDDGTAGEVRGSITYSYWGNPARAEKVDAVIKAYQAKNQGVTVTGEVADYNAYTERLTVRAAGSGLACLIGTQSTFIAPYAEKNVLTPLDPLIASGAISTADIPPDVLTAGKIDGKQYMLPTGTFVRVPAYNEEMIKKAGAPAPTSGMTWEQYATWLKKVQSGLPKGVHASEIEASNMFSLTSWVIGHGKTMFTEDGKLGFDKQLLTDWFQYWVDLTAAGVTVDPSKIPDQSAALELTPLALGQAAVGTRDVPQLTITEKTLQGNGKGQAVGHLSMPTEDPTRPANVLGTNGVSIPQKCDNKATAASFANFFANDPDAAKAFQSDNGILTNSKAQESLLADGSTPAGVKRSITLLRTLTQDKQLANTTYPDGLGSLTTELSRVYQQVAFKQISVTDGANAFFTSAEQKLG